MKSISILLNLLFAATVLHAEKSVHVMSLQETKLYRCTVLELNNSTVVSWIIRDFSTSEEKKIEGEVIDYDFEQLWDLVKESEDFQKNNQVKKNGDVGLDDGFIIALRDGNKKAKTFDLPADLESPDIEKLKQLIHWGKVKQ